MPARAPVKPTTNFHTSTRLSSPHVASSVTPWTRSRQPTHHSVTIQVAHNVHHPMAALHLVCHLPARFHRIPDIPTVYVNSPLEFIAVDYNNTHLTRPEPQQIGPHFNLSSVEFPGGSQSPQPPLTKWLPVHTRHHCTQLFPVSYNHLNGTSVWTVHQHSFKVVTTPLLDPPLTTGYN